MWTFCEKLNKNPMFCRHCEWLSEQLLEDHYKHTLRMYWRRMDPNVPPEVDDGSHEDMLTGKIDDKEKVFLGIKFKKCKTI